MNGPSFRVMEARVERHAAAPTLQFRIAIADLSDDPVESIALRCQIRIQPNRRQYSRVEEERLLELFGETPRWGDTLQPFLWTHVSTIVPGFTRATVVELPVAVTYDLEVAAGKYFHALDDGVIPVLFLFSGTLFRSGSGGLRIEQVAWYKEAAFQLPVRIWRALMDAYFPGCGWLRLRRDTLHGLQRAKARRALPTWDDVMVALLRDAGEAT